jgi:hypothetical protein
VLDGQADRTDSCCALPSYVSDPPVRSGGPCRQTYRQCRRTNAATVSERMIARGKIKVTSRWPVDKLPDGRRVTSINSAKQQTTHGKVQRTIYTSANRLTHRSEIVIRKSSFMTERHYWYRKTSWTESDREDFETRFARTRKASRAQYLKIQAWSLFEAGLVRESLSLIDRMFSDYPRSPIFFLGAFASREMLHGHRRSCARYRRISHVNPD